MVATDDSSKEKALKTVVKGAGISFVALVFSNIALYLTRLVLARALTPEEYGMLFLVLSIMSIVMGLITLSLEGGIQRYVPYYLGKNDMKRVKGTVISSLKISLPVSLLAFAGLFIFADQIAVFFFHEASLSIVFRILSLTLPFYVIYKIFSSVLIGFKKVKYDAISWSIGRPLSTLTFLFIFMMFGFGLAGATTGYMMGYVVSGILAFFFAEKKVYPLIKSKIKPAGMKSKLLEFSLPLVVFGILWNIMTKIDTILLGSLKTSFEVGVYQTAVPTSQFLFVIPAALGALFLPVVSELLSKEKSESIGTVYKTVSKWVLYINLPLLLVFIMYPNAVINTLFGPEYIIAGNSLRILSISCFIYAISMLSGGIISLYEKTKYFILNSGICLVMATALSYLLIPVYGIDGAAIANLVTLSVYTIMVVYEAYMFSGHLPFNKQIIKSLAAGIISIIAVYCATKILFAELNIWVLAPMFIIFVVLYSLLLLVFRGLGKEDIMILKAIEEKTGLRIKFLRDLIKKFT